MVRRKAYKAETLNGIDENYIIVMKLTKIFALALPAFTYETYLFLIPFIEVGLGAALLIVTLKRFTIWAWYAFMASLLIGHYILQEFSAVNQMPIYFILGMI